MRVTVLILAILGALCAGGLGVKWLSDYYKLKDLVEVGRELAKDDPKRKEEVEKLDRLVLTAYILIGSAVVGILAGVLVMRGNGLIGGPLLLVAGAVPPAVSGKPEVILFTFFLLLAGLLGVFVRKKPAPIATSHRRDRDEYEDEDDDRPRGQGRGRRDD
jgi:hypothetical protein